MKQDDSSDFTRRMCLTAGGLLLASSLAEPLKAGSVSVTRSIELALNENSYGPSPRVVAALTRSLHDLHRYVRQDEVDALSARIASLEQVSPGQVILGEVLAPLGLHLARIYQGGTIVYSSPGYTELIDAAAPLGGKGLPVPLNARLENDLPALAHAIDDRTIAISLVNPHNPSGTVSEQDAFEGFIAAAAKRTLVIVDEAYLEYDDLRRSAIRFTRAGANVVVFRTLGKIYGLAGLAIGYAIVPSPLAASLRDAGVASPHSFNRLALIAASAALSDPAYVAGIRTAVISERERLTRALSQLGLEHSESRASFIYFRSPHGAAEDRKAFAARGIEVARDFPPLEAWIRVTVGRADENDAVIAGLRAIYSRRHT